MYYYLKAHVTQENKGGGGGGGLVDLSKVIYIE